MIQTFGLNEAGKVGSYESSASLWHPPMTLFYALASWRCDFCYNVVALYRCTSLLPSSESPS